MKTTISEMKNTLDVINCRLYVAGQIINALEDIATEIMQNETHREIYNLKNKQNISELWDKF